MKNVRGTEQMTIQIDAKSVNVEFKGKSALKNVTFHLEGKKVYGLLGKNGAGKTTLLSLLASFREPSSGNITINGQKPFENAKVMQDVAFIYDRSWKEETDKIKGVLELVERYRPNYDKEYAYELVKKFNLPLDKPIKRFSKGMQSALNVVIGLAGRAPITIFDEAYQGMDAPTRELFYQEVLEEQAENPRLFILSTHLVSEMDYLFDEVLIIHKGELLLQENYEELVSRGFSITGNKDVVDQFTQGMQILGAQQLGNTKSVMVYGNLTDSQRRDAELQNLDIGTISLQELFIHLTKEES
jgi:ABC-2 type transport system ATP-binding protein